MTTNGIQNRGRRQCGTEKMKKLVVMDTRTPASPRDDINGGGTTRSLPEEEVPRSVGEFLRTKQKSAPRGLCTSRNESQQGERMVVDTDRHSSDTCEAEVSNRHFRAFGYLSASLHGTRIDMISLLGAVLSSLTEHTENNPWDLLLISEKWLLCSCSSLTACDDRKPQGLSADAYYMFTCFIPVYSCVYFLNSFPYPQNPGLRGFENGSRH